MANTGSTNGYLAGAQANSATIAYAMEANFGVAATGAYQRTRFTGENFRVQNSRSRPDEINLLAEGSQSVTTQRAGSGTLSGALSAGTYDDLLAAVLGNDWSNGAVSNGTLVKTWTMIEQIGASWFQRPGAYCTRVQLTFAQGGFSQAAFDLSYADETVVNADPAASYLAAPTGAVFDTVKNFAGVLIDGAAPNGVVRQIQITLERNGGGMDYGMAQAKAAGVRPGELIASGSIQIYFRDYSLYQRFLSEEGGTISCNVVDGAGNGYTFTFLNATLQNPQINAGGKNTTIVATFDIEGNPQAGGGTFSIAKIAPASGGN